MKKEKTGYFGTYRHFRRDSGAATAACLIHANVDGTFDIRAGFSFCNPEDNFSKPEGRRIATERLATNPVFIKNAKGIAPALIVYLRELHEKNIEKEIGVANYIHEVLGSFEEWFWLFIAEL